MFKVSLKIWKEKKKKSNLIAQRLGILQFSCFKHEPNDMKLDQFDGFFHSAIQQAQAYAIMTSIEEVTDLLDGV